MIGPLKYVLQKNLIQGEHQYRLFKINANNIIYDGETKIYHYNDSHTDFLKMLPYVTISFETYETELKHIMNMLTHHPTMLIRLKRK